MTGSLSIVTDEKDEQPDVFDDASDDVEAGNHADGNDTENGGT